eukprot:TRINITY_DN7117_c0_g1_i2.p1 TRINITY_DN7117_c0_g1~~TRINITY_DN7117_c0_g1_i2.p1  ORF type:complete len:174 (+),score=55.26 TRINITY_DN7117_c0_g1_i2:67-588(+)
MIILLTGKPGIGKTTVIQNLIQLLENDNRRISGFYTKEIRSQEGRIGFEIITTQGVCGPLARIASKNETTLCPFIVGKYFVDIHSFEQICLPTLEIKQDIDLYIIDEIGKMELLSQQFNNAIDRLFNSGKSIIATIPEKGSYYIQSLKQRGQLILVTQENRSSLFSIIHQQLN